MSDLSHGHRSPVTQPVVPTLQPQPIKPTKPNKPTEPKSNKAVTTPKGVK